MPRLSGGIPYDGGEAVGLGERRKEWAHRRGFGVSLFVA